MDSINLFFQIVSLFGHMYTLQVLLGVSCLVTLGGIIANLSFYAYISRRNSIYLKKRRSAKCALTVGFIWFCFFCVCLFALVIVGNRIT